MFANGDIPEGELILRIPRECCVTLGDALNDVDCGPDFRTLLDRAGPGADTVIVAGYLAKEHLLLKEYDRRRRLRRAGEKNADDDDDSETRGSGEIKFAPYLRTLPWERGVNAQEHVLFWEDEDVDSLLKGSLAYDDAVETRSAVKYAAKILNGIIGPVVRKARGEEDEPEEDGGFVFPWQSRGEEKPADGGEILDGLEEAVRGAFVISLSRAFAEPSGAGDGGEEDRLEPIFDMMQHSDAPNVRHKFSEDGSIDVTAGGGGVESGEELFNRYRGEEDANMPYHKFFTRFGFVPGVTEPVATLIAERSTIFFPQRAAV